jgi:dolichol-phosphate mannosyltransferase
MGVMTEKILAFIPAHNGEARIARVLARFRGPVSRRFHEILVLDDQSRDDTLAVAIAASEHCDAPRVTVGLNLEPYGLGGSHKAAFAYARRGGFSHVVALDGDDRADVMDVATLLSQGVHRRFDACLGARFAPGAKLEGYDWARALGARAANMLASMATRRNVRDLGAGLNVFAMAALEDADLIRYPDDERFITFLSLGLMDRGRSIRFFPIHWRDGGGLRAPAMKTFGALAEFALRRSRFRKMDYRETPRRAHEFEVAYAGGAEPAEAPRERRGDRRRRSSK